MPIIQATIEEIIIYLNNLWKSKNTNSVNLNSENLVQQNQEIVNSVNLNSENSVQQNQEIVNSVNLNSENLVQQNQEIVINENEVPNINLITDRPEFIAQVRNNLSELRNIGFRIYHNIVLEKEVNLEPNTVSNQDINQVYDFRVGDVINRNNLMKNISRCTIFAKYKSGDKTKPENFRYLVNHHNVIKIIDRIWCIDLVKKCGNNLPNPEIYKSNLVKSFNQSIVETAVQNTKSMDGVVLLDIRRAFDSLEWNILEDLLQTNLTRKCGLESSKEFVSQYMTVIRNRDLYYDGKKVEVSKG
jgi:hypothetical protein